MEKDVQIINELLDELNNCIQNGCGPFLAAIYDKNYNLISKAQNTVVNSNCSLCHAEVNAIKLAEEKLGAYSLSKCDLSLYVTSEPCIMCLGAIMWAGIKRVYYSTPSNIVEKITGFNEGYKPDWINQFKKIGIEVYPDILPEKGAMVLEKYVKSGGIIYKPE